MWRVALERTDQSTLEKTWNWLEKTLHIEQCNLNSWCAALVKRMWTGLKEFYVAYCNVYPLPSLLPKWWRIHPKSKEVLFCGSWKWFLLSTAWHDGNHSCSKLLKMTTSLSCCHLQYKQDKCAADNSLALWWINLSQSFCLQFDPRSFLKRERSSEIFSSNQSNTRLQWTMWIQIHRGGFLWAWRRRRRRSNGWVGGRGGWGFLPAFTSCIVEVLFGC